MFKKYSNTNKLIGVLLFFCLFLIMIRVKVTQTFFFGFLIWNLFLAVIPYIISLRIKKYSKTISTSKLIFFLSIWLLFFPNAPYIITDFIHLNHTKATLVWFDLFLIFTYANTGLILAILSMYHIFSTIKEKWTTKIATNFTVVSVFLCGFGVYLGRFLRFNSWDFFTSPITVFKQSLNSFKEPKAWFITFAFGSLLLILFLLFKNNNETKTSS